MNKSLAKFLLSLSVTPFLVFGTPALMVTSAHADAEISSDVSDDGGAWTDGEGSGGGSDSGWGEGDGDGWGGGWDDDDNVNPNVGDGCGDNYAASRC
jgi:hypothetical protein